MTTGTKKLCMNGGTHVIDHECGAIGPEDVVEDILRDLTWAPTMFVYMSSRQSYPVSTCNSESDQLLNPLAMHVALGSADERRILWTWRLSCVELPNNALSRSANIQVNTGPCYQWA